MHVEERETETGRQREVIMPSHAVELRGQPLGVDSLFFHHVGVFKLPSMVSLAQPSAFTY